MLVIKNINNCTLHLYINICKMRQLTHLFLYHTWTRKF